MIEQWTPEQLNNAMLYGVCLVCLTPREMRKTITEQGAKTRTHFELVRPCGHTETDIDRKLEEMT